MFFLNKISFIKNRDANAKFVDWTLKSNRKSGRVVYGTGLENQRGCKSSVGSNPTSSVLIYTYLETVKIVNSIILLHP